MQTLIGHISEDTAYVVEDYPYGFTLRCKIRYWLEKSDSKGFRFCTQTTNPKLSYEKWNAPKKSTYCKFGGAMYLNDENHVVWNGITEYSSAQDILKFVKNHITADLSLLVTWIKLKLAYTKKKITVSDSLVEEYLKDEVSFKEALEVIESFKKTFEKLQS